MAVPWNTEENPELQLIRSLLKQIIRRSLQIDQQFHDNQQRLKDQGRMNDLSFLNNQTCTNNQQNTNKEQLTNNQLYSTNQNCSSNQQHSINQQHSSNQENPTNQQHMTDQQSSVNQQCSTNQQYSTNQQILNNQQYSTNQHHWNNKHYMTNQKFAANQHLSKSQKYSANHQSSTNHGRGCCKLKNKVENVKDIILNPSSERKTKISRKFQSKRSLNVNQRDLICSDCPARHPWVAITSPLTTTDPNMLQFISSPINDTTTQLQGTVQQVSNNISGRNQQLTTAEASDRKRRRSKQKMPSRNLQQQLLETRKGSRISRLYPVSDDTNLNHESERQKSNLPDLIPLSPASPNLDQGSNPSLPDLIPRSSTPKQSSTFRLRIFQTAEKNSQFQKTGKTLRNIADRFEEETRMMNERDEEDGVRGYTRRRDEDVAERRNILLRTLFRSRDILDIRDILISTGLYFILRTLFNKF